MGQGFYNNQAGMTPIDQWNESVMCVLSSLTSGVSGMMCPDIPGSEVTVGPRYAGRRYLWAQH